MPSKASSWLGWSGKSCTLRAAVKRPQGVEESERWWGERRPTARQRTCRQASRFAGVSEWSGAGSNRRPSAFQAGMCSLIRW